MECAFVRAEPAAYNPEWAFINPEWVSINPNRAVVNPNRAGTNPDWAGIHPYRVSINQDWAGVNPDWIGMNPDWEGINPDRAGVNPERALVQIVPAFDEASDAGNGGFPRAAGVAGNQAPQFWMRGHLHFVPRKRRSASEKSSGSGASNFTGFFVRGWTKDNSLACSITRGGA